MSEPQKSSKESPHSRRLRKRGETIRRGFRFQDLVAARDLLDILLREDTDGPDAVSLENADGGSFDDIVLYYPQETLFKQVKWAANPTAEPLTVESLAVARRPKGRSTIAAFAESWTMLSDGQVPVRLQLVTNRTIGAVFATYIKGDPPRISPKLSKTKLKRLSNAWMTETGLTEEDFTRFISSIEFCTSQPSELELQHRVEEQLLALRLPCEAFHQLMAAIAQWATDGTKDRITASDVQEVLGISEGGPSNTFHLPRETLVERSTVHASLADVVHSSDGQYVVLLGAAGSGKSTALNTISPNSSLAESGHIILYNCFTGPGDAFLSTRARTDTFLKLLHREMRKRFPGRWTERFAPEHHLEEVLNQAATISDCRLIIIIDGLDYAIQNSSSKEPGLAETLPATLPKNLTLVVSTQTKEQLPTHLQRLPPSQFISTPALTNAQTRMLLNRHGVFGYWSLESNQEQINLSEKVSARTQGHALSIAYAASWLVANPRVGTTVHLALENLPAYGGTISDWYRNLPSFKDALTQQIVAVAAAAPCALGVADLQLLLTDEPPQHKIEDALSGIGFLFCSQSGEFQFRHDSLRQFALANTSSPVLTAAVYLEHLISRAGHPRLAEYGLRLAIDAGRQAWAFETVDANWLASALADGARLGDIEDGLQALLTDALQRRAWPDLSKWALLLNLLVSEVRFTLDDKLLLRVWLSSGHGGRAMRRVVDGEDLRCMPEHAMEVAELFREYDLDVEADRLERLAASTPLDVSDQIMAPDWTDHILPYARSLGAQHPVHECLGELRRIAAEIASNAIWVTGNTDEVELLRELAVEGAWGALDAIRGDRVAEWLTVDTKIIPSEEGALLKAAVEVLVQGGKASVNVVQAGLHPNAPLWLLIEAAQQPKLLAHVRSALEQRSLPSSLLSKNSAWTDADQYRSMASELYQDIVLSHQFGLEDRIKQIRAALPPGPRHEGPLLYALTVATAVGMTESSPHKRWRSAATRFLAALRDAGLFTGYSETHLDGYLGLGIAEIVALIGEAAYDTNDSREYTLWVDEQLLPALRQQRLNLQDVVWPIERDAYLPFADAVACRGLLDRLERETDEMNRHKFTDYIELAIAAADCGEVMQAERLIVKATCASFTYGYRKDATIVLFAQCLANRGPIPLKDLLRVASLCGSALETLAAITDYAGLYDCGSEVVAAIAVTDSALAARLIALLPARVQEVFFRESLVSALRRTGIDVDEAVVDFERQTLNVGFWPVENSLHPLGQPFDDLPESFEGICNALDNNNDDTSHLEWERQQELEYRLMQTVTERETFDRVLAFLRSSKAGHHWIWPKLARRMLQIGLHTEATELVSGTIERYLKEGLTYWYGETGQALEVLAILDPKEGQRVFESLCDKTIDSHGDYWGSNILPTLVAVLQQTGRTEEANACFDVFETHLRDLLGPYPSQEDRFLKQLDLPVAARS